MFDWKKIKKPVAALAPMADYTDSPFSLICKEFGADVIYREMVSAEALVRGSEKTLRMAEFHKRERPIILQIFGAKPAVMAEAAKILEEKYRPDGIDINMGCPARKIISNFNGASLMKEPKLAAKIVRAVKDAVKIPVSVKTRTGWSDEEEILKFAPVLEAAGADAVAIHGRTKGMGYSGRANWEIIGRARDGLSVPVLLNGDITDYKSFAAALAVSGADGVLVGRGVLGNPWIFKNIKNKKDLRPSFVEIKKVVLRHAKLHLARYGELTSFRKHLLSYFKGAAGAKKWRERLARVSDFEDIVSVLRGISE